MIFWVEGKQMFVGRYTGLPISARFETKTAHGKPWRIATRYGNLSKGVSRQGRHAHKTVGGKFRGFGRGTPYSSGVFIKLTRRGPNQYVQLVAAYRDDAGRPKQRTVATLGRIDQLNTELKSVIAGLQRVTGCAPSAPVAPPVLSFDSARDFGDVWTLTELWKRTTT
jgi:hypothetical protein